MHQFICLLFMIMARCLKPRSFTQMTQVRDSSGECWNSLTQSLRNLSMSRDVEVHD